MKITTLKHTKIISSNKRFFLVGFIFCMVAVVSAQFVFSGLVLGSRPSGTSTVQSRVLLLAAPDDLNNSNMINAITLDPSIQVNTTYGGTFLGFDCVILDADYPAFASVTSPVIAYVKNGGGLLLISSPALTTNASFLVAIGILNAPVASNNTQLATPITPAGIENNTLATKIEWNSMPEMANYTAIQTSNLNGNGTTVLLERFLQVTEVGQNKDPILIEKKLGLGHVLFHAGYLGNPREINYQVKIWPYFNYMFYASIQYLKAPSTDFATYGNWPYSPVPHNSEQITIGIYVSIMMVVAFTLFFIVRRQSKRTRLDQASLEAAAIETKKEEGIELDDEKRKYIQDLMASGMDPEAIEAELAKIAKVDLTDRWEQVGPARQIAGFLFGFFMGILVLIPQIAITGILFPQVILPFPQVQGWINLTGNFFGAVWTAFDVGTSVALAKYFAEYRVHQPEKAIHYAQIFCWWQMLSGIVQIFIVAFLGAIYFPQTYLAQFSWIFITNSLIQYPGFFLVYQYVFQGMQRTDYQLLTELLYNIVFNILFQIAFILLFRWLFVNNVIFGEALGAGIGYCIGQYFAQWGTFFFTVALFKRMNFSVRTVFRVDFTRAEFKEAMVYGTKFMLGSVWVPAVWLWQVFLQSIYVNGYASETGYFNLVFTFGQIVSVVGMFMDGLMAGISESHSHKKMSLLKLHTVQGIKWSNFMTFYIVFLLLMIGARLVEGFSGPTWLPAIKYFPLVLLFQALGPYSWQGDKMLTGSNNNGYAALSWIIEQSIRASLLYLLIAPYQMMGVLMAYIPALTTKNIFMWIVIRKKVVAPKPYFLVTWISPFASAMIVAGVIYLVNLLVWTQPVISAITMLGAAGVLFLIALFGGFYLYSFLTGVLGHWDKNTILEFDKATKMVKIVGFMARGMYKCARAGYMLCPFKDRWPLDVFTDGMREAHELEIEKKVLKI